MQILTQAEQLQAQCQTWRAAGKTIALVPTMGFYHAGHEDLMRHGRTLADILVVSLFVNPTQFGPQEDLSSYPRDLARDSALVESVGADILFTPSPESMYAPDHATWITVPALAQGLCGASRPVHFKGVCTVVMKLLMLSRATVAVFGEKDWQQLAIIRRMVRDCCVPVRLVGRPTVRESDGLALSSRNAYLTSDERAEAPEIRRGLEWAQEQVRHGEHDVQTLITGVLERWACRMPHGRVDYLSVVDPVSLQAVHTVAEQALMACAMNMGKARLIDNILLG
ncbi:MAG: pantoate--beta-alanine ligase [Desulfovibrionaceae bacterium]